uniref:Uncharacterized protein n=1 Tax=Anopheles dirus TaxID=7168 RepID=A0A182MXB7_9DIPT
MQNGLIVISKRYSNNSYSCYVRHTKDGLVYHLSYNVCVLEPTFSADASALNPEPSGLQCLYYECTITAAQLMADDGQLGCFRYAYAPPAVRPPMFDRITAVRQRAIAKVAQPRSTVHSRAKREFSWETFLEKISFMGRHQSSVSKQNEAYFHYNFMNRPGGGGGSSNQGVLLVALMAATAGATPVQCDDADANPEATYGKLQSIPPPGGDSTASVMADEPPSAVPSKTQQDVLKSRNSKFLGVDRSSEEE